MQATRSVTRCMGRIDAASLYTTEGCLRYAGLGRETLLQARKSGLVKPIELGRRMYYCGDELIAWIKSQR
jgi:hypothetical protein